MSTWPPSAAVPTPSGRNRSPSRPMASDDVVGLDGGTQPQADRRGAADLRRVDVTAQLEVVGRALGARRRRSHAERDGDRRIAHQGRRRRPASARVTARGHHRAEARPRTGDRRVGGDGDVAAGERRVAGRRDLGAFDGTLGDDAQHRRRPVGGRLGGVVTELARHQPSGQTVQRAAGAGTARRQDPVEERQVEGVRFEALLAGDQLQPVAHLGPAGVEALLRHGEVDRPPAEDHRAGAGGDLLDGEQLAVAAEPVGQIEQRAVQVAVAAVVDVDEDVRLVPPAAVRAVAAADHPRGVGGDGRSRARRRWRPRPASPRRARSAAARRATRSGWPGP